MNVPPVASPAAPERGLFVLGTALTATAGLLMAVALRVEGDWFDRWPAALALAAAVFGAVGAIVSASAWSSIPHGWRAWVGKPILVTSIVVGAVLALAGLAMQMGAGIPAPIKVEASPVEGGFATPHLTFKILHQHGNGSLQVEVVPASDAGVKAGDRILLWKDAGNSTVTWNGAVGESWMVVAQTFGDADVAPGRLTLEYWAYDQRGNHRPHWAESGWPLPPGRGAP